MVNEKSFITIQAFMVNDLHLKGNELLIYAIIWGFSQDGESEFTGSLQYLADWCNTSKQTVISALQSLCEKQLILKNVEVKNNIKFCTYKTSMVFKNLEQGIQKTLMGYSKNFNGGIQNSLPNNITNILDNNKTNNIVRPKKEYDIIYEHYQKNYDILFQQGKVQTNKVQIEYGKCGKLLKGLFRNYSNDELLEVLDRGMNDKWIVEGGYNLSILLSANQINKLLNGKNATSQNGGYVNNSRPASDSEGCDVDF